MSDTFTSWESEPTRRGTWSIILTCFTTLGISVWGALHLSIPKGGYSGKREVMRKTAWMFAGVLLPKLLITMALFQLLSAQEIRDEVDQLLGFPRRKAWYRRLLSSPTIGIEHTETEKLMRGNRLIKSYQESHASSNGRSPIGVKDASGEIVPCRHSWTTTHGFYATMGGFAIGKQSPAGTVIHQIISPSGFLNLVQERLDLIPEIIPDISEEAFCNKGKSDGLSKTLLVIQVGWFCVNCIGRLIQDLPLTLLEVSTAAHALSAVLVYGLWWKKPLNIIEPTVISDPGITVDARLEGWFTMEGENTNEVHEKMDKRITIIFLLVGLLYGAPHALGWNSRFATAPERICWRISTIAVLAAPCCFGALRIILVSLRERGWNTDNAFYVLELCTGSVYFSGSLYLIAASLRQLSWLPSDVFVQPVWSNYLPHVS